MVNYHRRALEHERWSYNTSVGAIEGDRAVSNRHSALKARMLRDPEVREAYEAMAAEFDVARELDPRRVPVPD